MSKVEGRGGPIDPRPPLRLRVTIFSRRLLGLKGILRFKNVLGRYPEINYNVQTRSKVYLDWRNTEIVDIYHQ